MHSGRIRRFRYAIQLNVTIASDRAKAFSSNQQRQSFARYFLDICTSRKTHLPVAAIKAELAVVVPLDADP